MASVVQPAITLGGGTQLQLPQDTPTTGVPAGGTNAWNNLGTNWAFDNTEIAHLPNITSESEFLRFKNFGFDVPAAATIVGVEVYIANDTDGEWRDLEDTELRLAWDASAATLSTDNKMVGSTDTMGLMHRVFGGATDDWGDTLTPTIVNSTDFGFVVRYEPGGGSRDGGLQGVGMRLFYTHTLTSPGNLRVTQTYIEVLNSIAQSTAGAPQRHPIIVT